MADEVNGSEGFDGKGARGPAGRISSWNEERKARKQAKRDAFWEPYRKRRASAEGRVGGLLAQLAADYRFMTALVAAMALGGFFIMRGLLDAVAVVGAVAMIKHWNGVAETPERFVTPAFGFWRLLAYASLPVAVVGTAYGLGVFVYGVATVGLAESFMRL